MLYFSTSTMRKTSQEKLKRMIQLADKFFGANSDPEQILVSQKEIKKKLQRIHPATMTEKRTAKGPVAWMLILPTTNNLMKQFIKKKISERELLEKTPLKVQYESIYLCSALVLPEYRRKGLAKNLAITAIKSIQKQYQINALFYWAFSIEGKKFAISIAKELSIPLYKRAN